MVEMQETVGELNQRGVLAMQEDRHTERRFVLSLVLTGLSAWLWLDAGPSEGAAYEDLDIPPEVQTEAEQIIGSFALLSGETPEIMTSGE